MRNPALILTVMALAGLLLGCSDEPTQRAQGAEAAGSQPDAVPNDRKQAALERARQAATALGSELSKRLFGELREGGPLNAVRVCSEVAQEIAAARSNDGLEVRRVSLRVRNPANAPDSYERAQLERLAVLHQQGQMPAEIFEIVDETTHPRRLRYLRPIKLMQPCLTCHGAPDKMQADIVDLLAEHYPEDQAVGYQVGELRGAISVTVEM